MKGNSEDFSSCVLVNFSDMKLNEKGELVLKRKYGEFKRPVISLNKVEVSK